MREPDHYRVLGVSPLATIAEIRTAYRRRLRETHPDHGGAVDESSLVQDAWVTLSHSQLRNQYDLQRFRRPTLHRYSKTAARRVHRQIRGRNATPATIIKLRRGMRDLWRERTPELLAATAARLGGRSRAWRKIEWAADLSRNPRPVRYALGLIRAALQMRLNSVLHYVGRGVRWVLASEPCTWTPLGILLALAGFETTAGAGPASAVVLVITGGLSLAVGVDLLRKYLQVKPRRKPKGNQSESDS